MGTTPTFNFGGAGKASTMGAPAPRDAFKLFDPLKNDATMREVRAMMPTDVLLGTGRADPMDALRNDPTMIKVREQGAPRSNSGARLVPTMPLLNPPAGGDAGMIPGMPMPQQSAGPRAVPVQAATPMRSPMAAMPSGQNHSYDGGLGFGPGLAGRGPVQKGRSGYDLDRIAQQRFRQTRDPSMLQSQQWYHLNAGRIGNQGGQQGVGGQVPLPPPLPAGHFEPGRSTGSQVWVRDAPGGPAAPSDGDGGLVPAPRLMPEGAPSTQQQPQDSQATQQMPFSFPVQPLPWDGQGPLPPSTLGGGTGVPPGPMIDPKNPQPLIPTPEQVKQFGLQPDFSKPQEWMGKQYPTFRTPKPEEVNGWQLYDAPGPMIKDPLTQKMVEGPKIKRQVNPITGETRDLVEKDAKPGDPAAKGKAAKAEGPGWMDWLNEKLGGEKPAPDGAPAAPHRPAPAPAPAAAQGPATVVQGEKDRFGNPMPPPEELQLRKAEADQHYIDTGDDSTMRHLMYLYPHVYGKKTPQL